MDEREWLVSENPAAMMQHLHGCVGPGGQTAGAPYWNRKLRLWACACCRQVWNLLTDPRSRRAVEVAERYADGLAGNEDLRSNVTGLGVCAQPFAFQPAAVLEQLQQYRPSPATQAALLRCVAGDPWRPVTVGLDEWGTHWSDQPVLALATAAYENRGGVCETCNGRCFVQAGDEDGRGWVEQCPDCHGTGTDGSGLLHADWLRVLSDALEEAGCPAEVQCHECPKLKKAEVLQPSGYYDRNMVDEVIKWGKQRKACRCKGTGKVPHPLLAHLRDSGPHVRGCWAVDLILGRE